MPILPCEYCTFIWLTLTSEMYFVRFHPEVTSCLLSRGKTKYATLGMMLWCKYIRNYLLVYQLTSHFLPCLQNYKEFEGEISDLQLEKYLAFIWNQKIHYFRLSPGPLTTSIVNTFVSILQLFWNGPTLFVIPISWKVCLLFSKTFVFVFVKFICFLFKWCWWQMS